MKVILEPTVTVISVPKFIEHPMYKIPSDGDDFVKLGAFCAKSCYDSFGENGRSNEENQRRILEAADGSVLEHLNITVFVEGVSRALSLESNRHRFLHPSQRSTRYTNETDAAIVLEPEYARWFRQYKPERIAKHTSPYWAIDPKTRPGGIDCEIDALIGFLNQCEDIFVEYEIQVHRLMELNPLKLAGFDLRKWARGKARQILPHALETRIAYTGSIRAWQWVIQVRSARNAEPEIRRLANALFVALKHVAPLYFEGFEVAETFDGIDVIKSKFGKI